MDAMTTRAPRTPRQHKHLLGLDTAARFLNFMGGDTGIIHTRTFIDDDTKKGWGKNDHLTLPVFTQDLYELDAQNRQGRGIFWVVNEGGQKAREITGIRALFVDYDAGKNDECQSLQEFERRLSELPPPHAIVESSPGKRHVYWKCQGVPVAEFKAMQTVLAAKLGTDSTVSDLPRVLRVPGFLHQKGKPQHVELLRLNEKLPPYTFDECRAFAPPEQEAQAKAHLDAIKAAKKQAEKGRDAKTQKRPPREPRQPSLPAQASPPADTETAVQQRRPRTEIEARLMASFDEAAKTKRPWPEVEAEQRDYDRECVASAVAFLAAAGRADSHDDWQQVGADLKGCTRGVEGAQPVLTDQEAFDLFDQFSETSSDYDPDGVEDRWEGIGTDIFGCGALLDNAKKAGWTQPPHPKSQRAKVNRALADTSGTVEDEAEKVSDDDLILNGKGHLVPCLANAVAVLGRAQKTKNAFRYNELTATIEYRPGAKWRPLTDADVPVIQLWIQRSAMPRIARADVEQGILVRGYTRKHHPIREWLDGLQWDGTGRVGGWLHTYLGAADNEYTRLVGRLFLIGMVARVMKPGCKMDNMLILEGPQGRGKSSALETLAGTDFFSDGLADIGSKDASLALRGRWLIEIAELAASTKAETEHLKAFISRTTERYRPPFGRLEVSEPRQCVLAGTTNVGAYLKDASGARRFWPVMVGQIDLDALARDRAQLFAEALHLYQSGAVWWPTAEQQQALFMPEQDARFEADPWESYVEQYLQDASEAAEKEGRQCRVTIADVATCRGINLEVSRTTTRENRRLVAILQRLGWVQKRNMHGRFYVKE